MEGIIIIGTGGFAIELAGLLKHTGRKVAGLIGPKPTRRIPEKWLGDDEVIETLGKNTEVLIAIGAPKIRMRLADKIKQRNIRQQIFIHPTSYISAEVTIKPGSIIYPNSTIHSGVVLQQNVLINSNATVGHETVVGEFSNIGPGASIGGCCEIGNEVFVGIGSSIIEDVKINNEIVIGAGSVVISDMSDIGTYVGVPAKMTTPN